MSDSFTLNKASLEPLFAAWEEPIKHRVRAESGTGAEERQGRRPSGRAIAQNLRAEMKQWRDAFYPGASDTTRYLLNHWFGRAHNVGGLEFRYYFCQREAVETLVYLKEVRGLDCLSQLIAEFGGAQAATTALGITEEEDAWTRYAFKMATGAGKTKVMSLAIVWSYFHALRESESPMARHFVVIAPNLTVFERLKEDFKPEGGGPDIFDRDPLIPVEWRGDWNLTTVLQDEASGASTGGTLYLTNIHRLFEQKRERSSGDLHDWMGPAVSKSKALDISAALRERITGHQRVMVLNDEAHHVWDPDSAWNEAITFLHETIRKRTGGGVTAQLDFSATPKDNHANYFKHIVCDTPLGEAVDAGIVKTPVIGSVGKLIEQATDNAAWKYEMHLKLGYERWLKSRDEWSKSGKKALIFIMCENTTAADEITARLNGDEVFKALNGKTINLHTNLKGKINKKTGMFVESDKDIDDEDLKALRKLSRELDDNRSPYVCIVSVLMLREGWDVRNVTTIVPLRPYNAPAGILPEQTLGRGLRRMTPPGQANEVVTVVEHEAFARLYRDELAQEGLPLDMVDVADVPVTTVSIYPDTAKNNAAALDILIPRLSAASQTMPTLSAISEVEVREAFKPYKTLPLSALGPTELNYEERHLISGELVAEMKVNLALLESGVGAVSFFVQELEYVCKLKSTHRVLAPLVQFFLEQVLFGAGHSLFDAALTARLSAGDVREHVRAVFVPLIRARTIQQQTRANEAAPVSVTTWRPYQVTVSERRPVQVSARTVFNLVPCNRSLEQTFAGWCDAVTDIAAFAKNAGPQCLRIDYLSDGMRLAFYTPDFFVRASAGNGYLIETKGQVDKDVPIKARAAIEWCKAASTKQTKWEYVFVPEDVFQRFQGNTMSELVRACLPSLTNLINDKKQADDLPLFAGQGDLQTSAKQSQAVVDEQLLTALPERLRKAADEAIALYGFFEKKTGVSYAPVFTALLGVVDEAAKSLLLQKLTKHMPNNMVAQKDWFDPYLAGVDAKTHRHYQEMSRNLKKTLVFKTGVSPLGLLRSVLDYALHDNAKLTGVFEDIRAEFHFADAKALLGEVKLINDFRNTRVAHQEKPLTNPIETKAALIQWVQGLSRLWLASKSV